jgi:hypothetical protein
MVTLGWEADAAGGQRAAALNRPFESDREDQLPKLP